MIAIGRFFFKYRNLLFVFLYIILFIPSLPIFSEVAFGIYYYLYPLILGLCVTISGQLIRGCTIGLVYILRGGREGRPYARDLVTEGIFRHCRNPLYIGNILMLLGVGILSNSFLFVGIIMPLFIFIYHTIVLAEEEFLKNKFGLDFDEYCKKVNRWIPNLNGLSNTFKNIHFNWKRWILKEYNTQFIWLLGITLILLGKYPELTNGNETLRNYLLIIIISILLFLYLGIRYLKKAKKIIDY